MKLNKKENYFSKGGLIQGTLILTLAGFITRLIGFFYRIFLSNTMGPEKLGIYQLIFPVYGVCFTLYASGIQTSISKMVASAVAQNNPKKANNILKIGILLSSSIAISLSLIVHKYSAFIARRLLLEARVANSISILAIVFPFCAFTACINGYYYGQKKASVPALSQLLEQISRVAFVYIFSLFLGKGDYIISCEIATIGLVLGEVISSIYNIISLVFFPPLDESLNKSSSPLTDIIPKDFSRKGILGNLFHLSLPLSCNRLFLSVLSSVEAVLIPSMLRKSGLSTRDALGVFGILNGMSIPFIMFPSTIANSFAVMLLPTVSEAQAMSNDKLIDNTTSITMKYSLLIGILSTGVFVVFGNDLGKLIFKNNLAGEFLVILAWLCPFLYLTTTLSSIINGLGKTYITFFNTIIGLSIRIVFVILLIPRTGIKGYLIGLLISQLIISLLDVYTIRPYVKIDFNAYDWILKPFLIIVFCAKISLGLYNYMIFSYHLNNLLTLFLACLILTSSFIFLLFVSKTISLSEFKYR